MFDVRLLIRGDCRAPLVAAHPALWPSVECPRTKRPLVGACFSFSDKKRIWPRHRAAPAGRWAVRRAQRNRDQQDTHCLRWEGLAPQCAVRTTEESCVPMYCVVGLAAWHRPGPPDSNSARPHLSGVNHHSGFEQHGRRNAGAPRNARTSHSRNAVMLAYLFRQGEAHPEQKA